MKKLTEEDFINKSNIVHNGKYDYSKVNYKGMNEKVLIYCKDSAYDKFFSASLK